MSLFNLYCMRIQGSLNRPELEAVAEKTKVCVIISKDHLCKILQITHNNLIDSK